MDTKGSVLSTRCGNSAATAEADHAWWVINAKADCQAGGGNRIDTPTGAVSFVRSANDTPRASSGGSGSDPRV